MLVASSSSPTLTALLPPPALSERRHRGLARRLVTVRWRAVFVTHPRRTERARRAHLYDPPDDYPLHSAQRV